MKQLIKYKSLWLVCFCFLAKYTANAQTGLLIDGTTFFIASGSVLYVDGEAKLDNNATLNLPNGATIEVNGNWTNSNNTDKTLSGSVKLKGANRNINDPTSQFVDLNITAATGTTTMQDDININASGILTLGAAKLALNQNTLAIKNRLTTSIFRSTGHIISAHQSSLVEWSLAGSSAGDMYMIPFGDAASSYLPLVVTLTSAGSSDGNLNTWTYRTDDTATPNNRPLPSGVTSLDGASGENAPKVLDRFWRIEFDGFVTQPQADAIFTYDDDEWNTANSSTNTITEANLQGQYWDGSKWNSPTGTLNSTTNKVTVSNANNATGVSIWTLVDNASPLPVELITFTGYRDRAYVQLEWQTTAEINNAGFDVQKSADGKNWQKIGFVEGSGTSTVQNDYYFTDKTPNTGLNYYRLNQLDFDGKGEFSKVISLNITTTVPLIEIYPNPSFGKTNLLIHNPSRKKMTIILTDNLGRTIWQSGTIENTALWRKDFHPEASGIYFISVLSNGQISNKKFVIIK